MFSVRANHMAGVHGPTMHFDPLNIDTAAPDVGETGIMGTCTNASLELTRHRVLYRAKNLNTLLDKAVAMAQEIERSVRTGDRSDKERGMLKRIVTIIVLRESDLIAKSIELQDTTGAAKIQGSYAPPQQTSSQYGLGLRVSAVCTQSWTTSPVVSPKR